METFVFSIIGRNFFFLKENICAVFWISPGEMLRSAYQNDFTKDEMKVSWLEDGDETFKE